ncbi:MAG: prolyl oligopeptidase family serine peptidase [Enhygromyxa sp.]
MIFATDEAGKFMVEACMTVADLRSCSPATAHASSAEFVDITSSARGGAVARTFDEEGVFRVNVHRGEPMNAIELRQDLRTPRRPSTWEDELRDCVWARWYLASLPWIDGNRVAIMGPSYGGY